MPERKCVGEGTCYPTNHVGAVIDERADAEAAVEELRHAGFTDIHQFHGEEAYAAIQSASQNENALARAWRRVRDAGDEGEVRRHFLSTLHQGSSFLIAYAATLEQVQHAHEILARHHAHDIWRLGTWTVERLPQWLPEQQEAAGANL